MKHTGGRWAPEDADRMSCLFAAKANGELAKYANETKNDLAELIKEGKQIKEIPVNHKGDLGLG
ncbi:MAG: hypothetical protein GX969_05660 [Firmicutes bacterium]|nr:hypothetical protein [Bacillota bacterium]